MDLDPSVIDRLEESFKKIADSLGQVESAMAKFKNIADKTTSGVNTTNKSIDDLTKGIDKNRAGMTSLISDMLIGQKNFKDVSGSIEMLDDKIAELSDQIEKASDAEKEGLVEQRKRAQEGKTNLEQLQQENASRRAVVDGLGSFGKGIGSIASVTVKTFGSALKGLQDGSNAFTLAGGLMEGAIDGMNSGAHLAGNTLQSVGSAAAMLPGPLRIASVAAVGLGTAINSAADAATSMGKFVIGYMVKQMELTVDSFRKATSAGAMYAGGMTELINVAHESGLTVKQFAEVLKNNGSTIAASGLSVSEGARKIGEVIANGGEGMRARLLKLGYSYEEQAGLIAETMRDMRHSGKLLTASNPEIAAETEKYAENLRVISDLTGDDAKKKMEESRQLASQLAFQQKLATLNETEQAAVMRAFGNMSRQQQLNFMDMVNFGTVLNKGGAIAMSASQGIADETFETYRAFAEHRLDEISFREIAAKHQAQITEDLTTGGTFISIAQAQAAGIGGIVGDVGSAMSAELDWQKRHTKEGIAAAEKAAKEQKKASDDLTNNFVKASNAAQELAKDLEDMVTPILGDFAIFAGGLLDTLADALNDFKRQHNQPTFMDKIWGAVKGAAGGGMGGAAVGSVVPGLGTIGGAITGGVGGGIYGWQHAEASAVSGTGRGSSLDSIRNLIGRAESDSSGGYNATHGLGRQNLTNMTLGQIKELQQKGAGAVGRYQFVPNTLNSLAKRLGYDDSTPFSPTVQDSLADLQIEQLGYYRYKSGSMPKEQFLSRLAGVWAGLPKDTSGKSVYEGDKYGNKATVGYNSAMDYLAKGGIADRPSIAGEAGPEAVVPLPDGRSIPVSVDNSSVVDRLEEMISLLRDQLSVSKKQLHAVS